MSEGFPRPLFQILSSCLQTKDSSDVIAHAAISISIWSQNFSIAFLESLEGVWEAHKLIHQDFAQTLLLYHCHAMFDNGMLCQVTA